MAQEENRDLEKMLNDIPTEKDIPKDISDENSQENYSEESRKMPLWANISLGLIGVVGTAVVGGVLLSEFGPSPVEQRTPTATYEPLPATKTLIPSEVPPTETYIIPTSTVTLSVSPDRFIIEYYDKINNHDYQWGWKHLSDDFIARNHSSSDGGYSGYVDWWESVNLVDVWSSNITLWDPNSAKVKAILHYEMKSGKKYEDTVYFHLLLDSNSSEWLIDATPTDW